MRHHRLEHDPPGVILVETEVEIVAGETPGLGDAERNGAVDRGAAMRCERVGAAGLAPEKGGDVPRHRVAYAEHRRVAAGVGQLVERASVEAGCRTGDLNMRVVDGAAREPNRRLTPIGPRRQHRNGEVRRGRERPGR